MSFRLVAYTATEENGKVYIRNSENDSIVTDNRREIVTFLAKLYGNEINKKAAWELDQFAAVLLPRLGISLCAELKKEPYCEAYFRFNDNDEVEIHELSELPEKVGKRIPIPDDYFRMWYYRNNQIGIQHGNNFPSFIYHLYQYWEDYNKEVLEPDAIKKHFSEITGAVLSIPCKNGDRWNPLKFGSVLSLLEVNEYQKEDGNGNPLMHVPVLLDIDGKMPDEDIDELANWCEQLIPRAAWNVNLAMGHWKEGESHNYDICSTYGGILENLMSIENATFTKSDKPVKCHEAVMLGDIEINDGVKVHPISCMREDGREMYPTGDWQGDLITASQVRWMYKWGIGTFKLKYGYFWTYDKPDVPLREMVRRLYAQRKRGGLCNKIAKRAIAGSWGKFIQRETANGEYPYYNPIAALQIKTYATLQVANFIYERGLQPNTLYIATDGVRFDKKIEGIPEKAGMGEWRYEGDAPTIILSPQRESTPTNKSTRMYYKDWVEMINAEPEETLYRRTFPRRISLSEAINMDDLSRFGEMFDFDERIEVLGLSRSGKQRYIFDNFPQTGRDLLDNKYYGRTPVVKGGKLIER